MKIKKVEKTCKICKISSQDMTLFCKNFHIIKDGSKVISYRNLCRGCEWAYKKSKPDSHLNKVNSTIREKKNVPCKDCGKIYHYCVMDFDHVRGEKEFNVASHGLRSISKLLEEIDKCDVVCSNCHRLRTFNRRVNKGEE